MKNIVGITFGFVLGVIVTGLVGWNLMPGIMLHENLSPYGVDETVNKIKENAISKGWVVPSVKPLHKSVLKHGGGELRPVMLVNICQANHAYNILREDGNKVISVFMPCTISVYQKSDGKTYVGTMNASLLGEMFGGTVAEVMSDVAVEQQNFIEFAK
jgi:uncharacterized protein (DUF302 family)